MIRHGFSLLAGAALAMGLFWMLALLVAPPERSVDEPVMSMAMSMVEAPEQAAEPETPPPEPAQTAPTAPLPHQRPPLRRSRRVRLRCPIRLCRMHR